MAMEPVVRRFDARDYLRILTKRKWFILMVALAATIIGGLYAVSYPKTYRAATTVLIRRQTKPVVWIGDRTSPATAPQDLALETQARIAASSDCADEAAKKLGQRTSDRIVTTAGEITSSINATPHDPDLIRVEAVHRQDKYALGFANEVAEAFVIKSRDLRRTESKAAKVFLEEALKRAQTTLDSAQAAAAAYQEQIGILVPRAESELQVNQLFGYRDSARKAEAELAASQAALSRLRAQLRMVRPFSTIVHDTPNPTRQVLLRQIEAEQLNLTQLRARYTESWPAVRESQRRLEALQAELARQPETVKVTEVQPDPRLAELRQLEIAKEREVAEQRSRLASLQRTVGILSADTRSMPPKLDHLQRLLDRAEMAKTAYQNILAQLETARLNEAMKQADAEIIDHATVPEEISPKLGRMLMFSFFLGVACGVALAMLLEALDDTFHTPDDITTYTDVTFLGIVPLLEEPGQGLITIVSPKSPPAEAYRTLRSNIHFAQLDNPVRTFLVTSAGASEGKTLTTANLATVFAQAGQDVILIDTDLRRPSVHRLFNLSSEHGLTNVLVGEATLDEVIQDTDVPGLRVVTTGPLPPNPAELIESRQMTTVINRARELADVVFFDSPPAIILTDAVILSSKVDRTIFVAEAGQVSRDAFNEMTRMIRNARGTILGVVLNKLRLSASDYYYYYYYYDYSHYSPRREPKPQVTGPATQANQGLVRPETPTVLDTLFGDEDNPAGAPPPIQPEVPPSAPPSAAPVQEPEPEAAPDTTVSAQPPTGPGDTGARSRRWRFNGRSFRAGDTPETPAPTPAEPEAEQPQAPPAAPKPPTPGQPGQQQMPTQRDVLDELFGHDDDDK